MLNNNLILNRLFAQSLFYRLPQNPADNTYATIVQRYVSDSADKNNGQLISEIYSYMSRNYRNEYFYQNTLLNKLLLGRHSVNTTTALTQVPVGKSRADFIMINGKAVVYEIKTELDNFDRLQMQLHDYYMAFDHVCMVTSENNCEKACELLEDTAVGIYVLTDKNTLSNKLMKEPERYTECLDYTTLFKLLRKKEYEDIIQTFFGSLPEASQAFFYTECLKLFQSIPMDKAYKAVIKKLKDRNKIRIVDISEVPYELRSLVYFTNPTIKEWKRIDSFLQASYAGG